MLLEYSRLSRLDLDARRLTLETVTPSRDGALGVGLVRPRFFDGFLTFPAVAAACLRQVAQVAATEYVDRERPAPSGADPLVTSDGSRLRFEAFSHCGGVLARFDVLPAGLDGAFLDRGTTNVDVNEPLRRLLTRVTAADFLHLDVGTDGLVATSPTAQAAERKVVLSDRWLRGLAEAQASGATFDVRAELTGLEALRWLQTLSAQAQGWLIPSGRGVRLTSRPVAGAVWLSRAFRLETLWPLLPHARRIRIFGPTVAAGSDALPSAWELELPGARYVLHLSASPSRGFSGEGSILGALTGPTRRRTLSCWPPNWTTNPTSTSASWQQRPGSVRNEYGRGWRGWRSPGGLATT